MQSARSNAQYQALYQATIEEAASGGSLLMGKLVAAARLILQTRQAATRDLRERDTLEESARQLRQWEPALCRHYPKALLEAFAKPVAAKKPGIQITDELEFDQLELMDESQVLTSVALARIQQVTMLAAEASLTELNTLISTTLGLGAVHPERNPLRPEIYINALKEVIEQTRLPAAVQLDWLGSMSAALGNELRHMYTQLSANLRRQGVAAAGYAVVQTPTGIGIGRGIAQSASVHSAPPEQGSSYPTHDAPSVYSRQAYAPPAVQGKDAVLLTLDKLRQLLTGELETHSGKSALEVFSQRFAREFEGGEGPIEELPSEFDATVPAALEALNEMKQVDHMVHRLEARRGGQVVPLRTGDQSVEAVRESLRSQADGVAQALSLEVVTLLVDNIARDIRLLEPVQQLIRRLEPPLLRLALVDPRLFSNKLHPARVLLQEIANRSFAFAMVNSAGFGEFMHGVENATLPLLDANIDSAEPFERALSDLQLRWSRAEENRDRLQKDAVKVLKHAEDRNLLAERIAREIDAHPDAAMVPEVVVDFLCGPWAQVVAQARLSADPVAAQADKYQSLIAAMLWSTHPTLTRKQYTKLTRLVPPLLNTLREGLDSIHYPPTKTSAFLEALMGLHQKAFRAAQKTDEVAEVAVAAPRNSAQVRLVENGNPWVAPAEAALSNFMALPDVGDADYAPTLPPSEAPPIGDATGAPPGPAASDAPLSFADLPLGSWAEMLVNGQWVRTQLTWASPHGTLFLFTSAYGTSQSMTRRSRDKMVQSGTLRLISSQPVVEGALNAVAQIAMRNSVDSSF